MSTPLVDFFTRIGFDIDTKSLNTFNSMIDTMNAKVSRLASSLNSINKNNLSTKINSVDKNNLPTKLNSTPTEILKVSPDASKSINALGVAIDAVKVKAESLEKTLGKLDNSKVMNAASRLMNAEARKIAAENRTATIQAATAKVQSEVEKLKQATLKEEAKVSGVRAKTAQIEQAIRYTEARTVLKSTLPARHDVTSSGGSGGVLKSTGLGRIGDISVGQAATAIATSNIATDLFRTANFTQSRMPQFTFLTGSAEKAKEQIDFVDREVQRLSLNLISANTQYKQLLASGSTSIGVENTQKLFTNFNNLSTMLGLGEDAQKRATNAFSQMMSKGQIMAEELNFRLAA